jgi:small subunit ribosomal protein S17
MDTTRNQRRTLEGTVTSDRSTKTITVEVQRTFKHPKYKKYVRKVARYHAHDEKGEAKTGDKVEIRACRPLSATKRWMLVRVIDRAVAVDALDAVTPIGSPGGSSDAGAGAETGGRS